MPGGGGFPSASAEGDALRGRRSVKADGGRGRRPGRGLIAGGAAGRRAEEAEDEAQALADPVDDLRGVSGEAART